MPPRQRPDQQRREHAGRELEHEHHTDVRAGETIEQRDQIRIQRILVEPRRPHPARPDGRVRFAPLAFECRPDVAVLREVRLRDLVMPAMHGQRHGRRQPVACGDLPSPAVVVMHVGLSPPLEVDEGGRIELEEIDNA
jgi:hypothetical protein